MIKGIYGVLIGMLIIMLVMYGNLAFNSKNKEQEQTPVENPKYHLQLLIENTNENFWTSFEEGAIAAQADYGVYIELVPLEQMTIEELKETVEMGVNAGVDGIALQAADSEQTKLIIEAAKQQGVSVLTYKNNNFIVSETPVVGTNSYYLGSYAGDMAVDATNGQAEVAVIINNAGNEGIEEYQNNFIQGLLDSFSDYSAMSLSDIYTIDADMFEAEKVASEIIRNEKKPDLVICIDEKCTPGIAQILVDNNMVGDIKLVGYGITKLTLDYIDHGVIYGIICPDAYEIGYKTVKVLAEMLDGKHISDSITTGLYRIDKSNIKKYLEEIEAD
jgi:ribose transport system substrate-binding protein